MRERWTDDAKWVMDEAGKVAAVRGELLVGTGHVLLGLLDSPEERLPASLRVLGVPLEQLRAELLAALAPVTSPDAPATTGREPAVRRAEELALREALNLGHSHINSAHLLLALLREPEHLAGSLLLGHGLDREVASKAVQELFRSDAAQGRNQETDQARVLHRLDELGRELGRLRRALERQPSREVQPGGQASYLVGEHDGEVLLVVTRLLGGEVESSTRRFPSEQEAVRAVVEHAQRCLPDLALCVINGEVRQLSDLHSVFDVTQPE